ncbi:MAG TPA: hypothetical protein VFQ51_20800, partial [Vicinamibacteria bacterium]|nr:hypothetical protein [Vicinamibacteria bacterium]
LALGFTSAVVVPTALFVAVGSATGGPMRGQDPWLADVAYAGGPATIDEAHPPRVREAWSSSFRQEPPAALMPAQPSAPGTMLFGRALTAVGLRDPRPLLIVAFMLAAALAVRARRARWATALAVTLLAPALTIGLALGAPDALVLMALLPALAWATSGHPVLSSLAIGLGGSVQLHALAAMVPVARERAVDRRHALIALGTWTGMIVLALVVVSLAGWDWNRVAADPPSLGLGGLLAYWGAETPGVKSWMLALPAAFAFLIPPDRNRFWIAALILLVGLWIWGVSVSWLGAPITLLGLGALEDRGGA